MFVTGVNGASTIVYLECSFSLELIPTITHAVVDFARRVQPSYLIVKVPLVMGNVVSFGLMEKNMMLFWPVQVREQRNKYVSYYNNNSYNAQSFCFA